RLGEVFRETTLAREERLHFVRGRLAHGFRVLTAFPPAPSPRRGGLGRGDNADTSLKEERNGQQSLPCPLPSREGASAGIVLISAAELFHRQELARPSQ